MSESLESEKYVGERGPDKVPREFNPKSLYNLKQYKIPENIPDKSNLNYLLIAVFVVIFIAILGMIIWKIYDKLN